MKKLSSLFEGDTQVIICTIQKKDSCSTWFEELIEDLKVGLATQPLWNLQFTHRESNQAAHVMAKLGLTLDYEHIWI